IFARIPFRGRPAVIIGQDESRCGGGCKYTPWGGDIEIRGEVAQPPPNFTLLAVRPPAPPSNYPEDPGELPVVDREKMGCGRAQSYVQNCRSAQFQEYVGQRCAIATCTYWPARQTKQKIRKRKQCERSVRGVGAFIELITEYLRSKTKIVPTSR